MKDIRRFLQSIEPLLGQELTAGMRWNYEKARAQGKILLPPPSQLLSDGEYELGRVVWNEIPVGNFGLREKELPQHISIFGRTGSGKTNCTFLLLQQLVEKNKSFLIFDWKHSYRILSEAYNIKLYTPGCYLNPFFFNPLDTRNIPKHLQAAYIRHLLSVLMNVYFRDLKLLSIEGTEYLLLKGMDYLNREKGKFTFLDLYQWAINYKGSSREKDWKSSVLNVLYKLSTGPIGEVLNNEININTQDLVSKRTIIELHWLGSPKDKSFLMQSLLLQLYYHFSQQNSTQQLKFAIIIEEAHNILLKHSGDYETVAEMILRQIREYGVSICLLDQHPSLMSLPALGTYIKIIFNLTAYEDTRAMAAMLSLDEDREYLVQLKTGQAIVKLQDRFIKPFLVEFPKAEFESVEDSSAASGILPGLTKMLGDSLQSDQDSGKIEKSTEGEPWDSCNRDGILPKSANPSRYSSTPAGILPENSQSRSVLTTDKVTSLKKNPKDILLIEIFQNPLTPTSLRYKQLGWYADKGNKLKGVLLKENLIKEVVISVGTQRIKLFELTELGKQYLRDHGIDTSSSQRKGSLLHQYWHKKAQECFEKNNYGVLEEIAIGNGRAIDLVAINDKQKIAIEIETGKSDFLSNIKKCAEGSFEKIVVVATSMKVKKKIKEKIAQQEIINMPIVVATGNEFVRLMKKLDPPNYHP